MTQTPLKLIVPLPENDINRYGRESMSRVCGGNDAIGEVLNFFVYRASGVAQHLTTDGMEFIRIENCMLDDIIARVKVSKKTLNTYMKQLETWGYIKSYGYQHTYDVYFRKITDALANPPDPVPAKLRGRHVFRSLSPEEEMLKLQFKMLKLRSEMLNLTFKMLKLRSENANLTFPESCEAALNQSGIGDFGEDRILKLKDTKEGEEARAPEPPVFASDRKYATGNKKPAVETEGDDAPTVPRIGAIPVQPPQPGDQGAGMPASSSERAPVPIEETPITEKLTDRRTKPPKPDTLPAREGSDISPSSSETFGAPESKKMGMLPQSSFISKPPEGKPPQQLPLQKEPCPRTRKELEAEAAEFERQLWDLAERKIKTKYPAGIRHKPWNKDGVAEIFDAGYTLEEIGVAFDRFRRFNVEAFDMPNLYKWLPNLLSARLTDTGKSAPLQEPAVIIRPASKVNNLNGAAARARAERAEAEAARR